MILASMGCQILQTLTLQELEHSIVKRHFQRGTLNLADAKTVICLSAQALLNDTHLILKQATDLQTIHIYSL